MPGWSENSKEESMDCNEIPKSSQKRTKLGRNMAGGDFTFLENKPPTNEFQQVNQTFKTWPESMQMYFMEKVITNMGSYQLDKVDLMMRPMFKRDFISLLCPEIATSILLSLDPKTIAICEGVCRSWKHAIARTQIWRKIIEKEVASDDLWKIFGEKRKWSKYVFVSRETAAKLLCEHLDKNYQELRGTDELIMLQHEYYRDLYPQILKDIKRIDDNWRNGNFSVQTIDCNSQLTKGVYCLQYDDDKIVSGLRDNTIKIWDRNTLSCLRTLSGHTGSVLSLHFDDKVIITGSSDASVRIWDIVSGVCIETLNHHTDAVLHLKYRNGKMLTSSKDRTVAIFDLNAPCHITLKGFLLGHRAAVNVVDFDDEHIVSASGDRTIKIWDTNTHEEIQTLTGHKRGIACLQLNGNLIVSGSSDNTLRMWNVQTGACIRVLEGHNDLIRCLRFDNRKIVSGDYAGVIRTWDLQVALDLKIPDDKVFMNSFKEHTGRIFRVQFDNFSMVTSSSDDKIIIWSYE